MRTIFDKIVEKIFLKMNVYCCDLRNYTEESTQHIFFESTSCDNEKMNELLNDVQGIKQACLRERMKEKHSVVFLSYNVEKENVTGYFCASTINQYECGLGQDIEVPKNMVYFFDDFVFENERGKRIHGDSIKFRKSYYKSKGNITDAMVCIANSNKESRKSYLNNGFTYSYSICCIRPLGVRWVVKD